MLKRNQNINWILFLVLFLKLLAVVAAVEGTAAVVAAVKGTAAVVVVV